MNPSKKKRKVGHAQCSTASILIPLKVCSAHNVKDRDPSYKAIQMEHRNQDAGRSSCTAKLVSASMPVFR